MNPAPQSSALPAGNSCCGRRHRPSCCSARPGCSTRARIWTARDLLVTAGRSRRSPRPARSNRTEAPRWSTLRGCTSSRLRRPPRPPAHARTRGRGGPRLRHAGRRRRRLLLRARDAEHGSGCRQRLGPARRCTSAPRARRGSRSASWRRSARTVGQELPRWRSCATRERPASPTTACRSPTHGGCARRSSTSGWPAGCSRCTRRSRRCPAPGVMHEGAVSTLLGLAGIPSISESIADRARRWPWPATRAGGSTCCTSPPPSRWRRSSAAARTGIEVTAEVTPHHLTLTDDAVRALDPRFKMNPPLRAEPRPPGADRRASRPASSVASRPTTRRTRARRRRSPSSGRRWASPVSRPRSRRSIPSWSRPGRSSSPLLVERMTAGGLPYGLPTPTLAKGAPADLCLVDLEAEWKVGESGYESRSENSCFAGGACAAGC